MANLHARLRKYNPENDGSRGDNRKGNLLWFGNLRVGPRWGRRPCSRRKSAIWVGSYSMRSCGCMQPRQRLYLCFCTRRLCRYCHPRRAQSEEVTSTSALVRQPSSNTCHCSRATRRSSRAKANRSCLRSLRGYGGGAQGMTQLHPRCESPDTLCLSQGTGADADGRRDSGTFRRMCCIKWEWNLTRQ
jgi:hypothetical protein